MPEPEVPPEAILIEQLRGQLPEKEGKVVRVAKVAGIHESRWRQIAKGYQPVNKDTRVPVVAPAGTLARMARAVGATPEALEAVGRKDAALELSKLPSAASMAVLDDVSDDDLVKEIAKRLTEGRGGRVRGAAADEVQNPPGGSPPRWRLPGEEPRVLGDEDRDDRDEGVGG